MRIKVSADLRRLEYHATGPEVAHTAVGAREPELFIAAVRDPVLVTDPARLLRLPAVRRDAVMNLLRFPDVAVEYDGVTAFWSPRLYPNAWSPTIDTLLFAKAIRRELVLTRRLRRTASLLEIGTGSGFLAKYVLARKRALGPEMDVAHLTDIHKDALRCALDNLEPVRGKTLVSYTHTQADARLKVDRAYDLVIANPPYVPRPRAGRGNPYEGLFLYGEMIRGARRMLAPGGVFMTMLSSLSRGTVEPGLREVFNLREAASLRVPLKIPVVTAGLSSGGRAWVRYLKKTGCLEEDRAERSGHRFWQTLTVVVGVLRHSP